MQRYFSIYMSKVKVKRLLIGLCACSFLIACQVPVDKITTTHPNGLKQTVQVFESDQMVELIMVKKFHMNNIRASTLEMKNGVAHGDFKRWTTTGLLVEEGQYAEGLKVGTWTSYMSRTQILEKGDYFKGYKDGVWRKYWPQGIVKSEAFFKQGKQINLEKNWYFDGSLKSKHNCFDYGNYREYFHNNQLKVKYDCTPKLVKNGAYFEYDLLGHVLKEFHYTGGDTSQELRDATWIWMNALGDTTKVRRYKQGFLDGVQTHGGKKFIFKLGNGSLSYSHSITSDSHSDSDSISVSIDSTWRFGKLNGLITSINKKGYFKEEVWALGQRVSAKRFRLNPKTLVAEGGFKNNLKDGAWFVWHPNGQISQKLNYEADQYMGKQTYHDTLGVATMVKTFRGKNQKVLVKILGDGPFDSN